MMPCNTPGWEVTTRRRMGKEMTSVRPILSSWSLIAASGAGVEMQAPRRQVGVAVALALCLLRPCTIHYLGTMYTSVCTVYFHHETQISTSHLPLSDDTTTHIPIARNASEKPHLCVFHFHPATRFSHPLKAARVKPDRSAPPQQLPASFSAPHRFQGPAARTLLKCYLSQSAARRG